MLEPRAVDKILVMVNKTLTRKQNEFALAVHDGATYSDAYRRAYTVKKMQPETIHAEASRRAGNDKVTARARRAAERG